MEYHIMHTFIVQQQNAAHWSTKYTYGACMLLAILVAVPAHAGEPQPPKSCYDWADECCSRHPDGMNRRICQVEYYKYCANNGLP